ncbi:MAG: OmpA family protein [Proteobacteria bacterium]|nr:OmpA family protein [Pseudomonadota bacterium]
MLALLAISTVLAATPHGDLHVGSGVGADGSGGVSAGGSVGVRVHPRVRIDLRGDAGLLPQYGAGVLLRPEIRYSPTEPRADWGRFDLVGGLGGRATTTGLGEVGFLGGALQVPFPGSRSWDLRVEGGYLFDHTGLGAATLSLGPVFDVRRRAPEVLPEPEPEPVIAVVPDPPPGSSIVTDLTDVEVWFPHPICRWMPLDQANELLATMDEADVQAVAPGHRSAWLNVRGATPLELQAVSKVGSLVVVTALGDQVEFNGHTVSVNEDGVLLLATEPGSVVVDIVGNGRRQSLDLIVAPEMTTWARASEPQTLHVTFPADSAVLSSRGRQRIREIAEAIGDARFKVEGSYSPEGNEEENRALAADRARAGQQALIEAGVPEERVEVILEPKKIESTDWRVLRAAVITPSGLSQ